MKGLYFCFGIILCALVGVSTKVYATPILLTTISANTSGSSFGAGNNSPEGVVFILGFRDFDAPGSPFDCNLYIGCEKVWGFGETGSFDFTASNTNALMFSSIVSKLTNGFDERDDSVFPAVGELLARGAWTINSNSSSVFPGSVGGGLESFFNIPLNATIDFFRLVVTEVSNDSGSFGIGYSYQGDFQVWGNEPATLNATAPSALGILLVGLGFFLVKGSSFRNKRQ